MKAYQLFLAVLRSQYKIKFSSEMESYFEIIYNQCIKTGNLKLCEYASHLFKKREFSIIMREIKKGIEKAKRKSTRKINQNQNVVTSAEENEKWSKINRSLDGTSKLRTPTSTATSTPPQEEQSFESFENNQKVTNKVGKKLQINYQSKPKDMGIKQWLDSIGQVKCNNYPFCDYGDQCHYFHPTERCIYFPKCTNASNCLYSHEYCRYGSKCCRIDCCYDHDPKIQGIQCFNALIQALPTLCTSVSESKQSEQEQ